MRGLRIGTTSRSALAVFYLALSFYLFLLFSGTEVTFSNSLTHNQESSMTNVTRCEVKTRTNLFIRCPVCGSVLFYLIRSNLYVCILLCDGCGNEFFSKVSEDGDMLLIPLESNED